MSAEPWSDRPKVDELSLTDILMRRVPTGGVNLNQEIPFTDVQDFLLGSATVLVASEDDLPPPLNGFRQLEIDKNYLFTEPGVFVDNIIIPAGFIGTIKKSFLNSQSIIYLGVSPMFTTLLLDGDITSIADSVTEPGVKSTVTTLNPHGLSDSNFVNITGTLVETAYSQQSLVISNVTASTFDIEIVFTATDIGLFNTGYGSMQFIDYSAIGNGLNVFMVLESAGVPSSSLVFTRVALAGFIVVGSLRGTTNLIIRDSIFAYVVEGLEISNCISGVIDIAEFVSLNPAATSFGIAIVGGATKRFGAFNVLFTMAAAGQFPVFIDGNNVINADELIFQNSPDNNVADDYFDVATVGIGKDNPQVFAINNGTRPDSQTIGAAFVNGNAVVTTIAMADVFQDMDFGTLLASASMESFLLTNETIGEFRYIGLKPLNSPLSMSITIRKVSGSTQIYDIKFVIDKGVGFVDFADNIVLPFEVKTTNDSGPYECQAQLENGDIIKPQIEGVATTDDVIVDSVSINF